MDRERLELIERVLALGITSFDHADIYGDYTCETLFGDALALNPSLRDSLQLITKCGIKLISKNRPTHTSHHYDYSFEHILQSVEHSLRNFRTDRIDLLLLHRPAPFFNPEEVAAAFRQLYEQGKVLNFGVSNFNPGQFDMLDFYCDHSLVTNQIEVSPYCLEHFENGNIDFFLTNGVKPMVWSPLAGGRFMQPKTEHQVSINQTLHKVAEELAVDSIDQIMYAWLLQHPVGFLPIVGSGKIERIKKAAVAMNIQMTLAQWYEIYVAASGSRLP
jgi:predicted oxidoreductase